MTHMTERLLDTENEAMAKIVELEKQLMQTNKELDTIRDVYASANNQVHTLRRIVREKDQTIRRQSRLERHAQEGGGGTLVVQGGGTLHPARGEGDGGVGDLSSTSLTLGMTLSPSPETVGYGLSGAGLGMMPAPPPPPPPPPMPGMPGNSEC
uniref:Uncharacterized protein n=1 Tax=Hucho hucho TaxID=62062 RepID=A0A4W5NAL5_9TELE